MTAMTPQTPVAAPTAVRRAGARPSFLLMMRLDYETITDSGASTTLVSVLCPLLFPLLGFLIGAVGATAICLTLTVGYWALLVAGLFVNTNAAQSGRLSALLPVTRAHQVVGRYLSAGVIALICLAQILVQYVMLWLIALVPTPLHGAAAGRDAVTLAQIPLAPVTAAAMAAFVLIVALEMPFYYALEFAKASSWFWSAVFMIAALAAIWIMLVPDGVQRSVLGALAVLPAWGWAVAGVACCAAAIAVSYAVSRRIWLRKEL